MIIAIAVLIAITMPFGYWVEVGARPRSPDCWNKPLCDRLMPWFLGHIPQVAVWLIIIMQFYDGTETSERTPTFVHAILWGELVLFSSFAAASLVSQIWPPKFFYRGELIFQVLSLVSKGLLGALMLAFVLMLSSFEEVY